MIFADLIFLYLFLPINLIIYYQFANRGYRNIVLILFSLFFYAWGEPVWVILLIFSSLLDYSCGLVIDKNRGKIRARLAVIASIFINIGLLVIFKYSGFITENINLIFNTALKIKTLRLPIGISFYTFQTISYTIDVYREKTPVQKSFLNFLMYVSLYFQLVAGPIVRYSDISNQIEHRHENINDLSKGLTRFSIGLTKKVLIANVAGKLSVPYLSGGFADLSVVGSWFGAILFTLQIYFDFSGYSDMAIGLGEIFGFSFNENFNYPYISKTVSEFWRRWHISLGSFFRDYVYIPLGGNKHNRFLNLLIVWFLTGLWHGASWNFIIWGLFYGILIVFEKFIGKERLDKIPSFLMHFYLIFIVIIGWVIFYFEDISQGITYLSIMFGNANNIYNTNDVIDLANNIVWLLVAIVFSTPITVAFRNRLKVLPPVVNDIFKVLNPVFNIILIILSTAMLTGQSYNPFLYYRF